jgi:hypothetical protein
VMPSAARVDCIAPGMVAPRSIRISALPAWEKSTV